MDLFDWTPHVIQTYHDIFPYEPSAQTYLVCLDVNILDSAGYTYVWPCRR
jgi:hypothetical protein